MNKLPKRPWHEWEWWQDKWDANPFKPSEIRKPAFPSPSKQTMQIIADDWDQSLEHVYQLGLEDAAKACEEKVEYYAEGLGVWSEGAEHGATVCAEAIRKLKEG